MSNTQQMPIVEEERQNNNHHDQHQKQQQENNNNNNNNNNIDNDNNDDDKQQQQQQQENVQNVNANEQQQIVQQAVNDNNDNQMMEVQHNHHQQQPVQSQQHQNPPIQQNINPVIAQQSHNHPQHQPQQQQQQGQLPQSHHSHHQQQQSHNQQSQQQLQKDKDSYINRLQIYLNKVKTQLTNKSLQYQSLTQQNKKTKQTLKKIRFDFLSTKQQLSTTNQLKSQLQKHNQNLTKSNQQLNTKLQTYKQAGDINFYKNKIIELQKLLQVQKKQLQIKTTMIDQKDQLDVQLKSSDKNKVQILNLIEKYQRENKELQQKYQHVMVINTQLENTNKANLENIAMFKITLSESVSALTVEKQKTLQLQQQLKTQEQDFQKKLKQLQQNLQQLINDQQNQKQGHQSLSFSSKKVIKSPQEQYGIKILTPIEERNLIMREFIDLQIKNQSLTQELNNLRERHYNTLREAKNIAATHVPKKDFSELYKKYVKLRKYLESSLINEQNLRKQLLKHTNQNNDCISEENQGQKEAESQAFTKYKTLVLQEPQNQVKKIDKIIQKSSDSQKQLYTLKQQLQTKQKLIRTQKLIKQKEQKNTFLEKQNQKFKNLIQLYDTELNYKNKQIQLLRKSNQQAIDKIFDIEKNSISKAQQQQLNALIEQNKVVNQILQIKNIQAMKENAILKSEKQNLTELYNDLKNMYEDLINREPELQKQQNKQHEQKQSSAMEIEQKPCKQCLERQEKLKSLTFSQVETQTEGLSQIYFKEIKELLTVLRKFPKKVETITGVLEAEKSTIHEVKKRYDQVMEAYGIKYRQLEEEKKANDQWRLKQKDQIREQFQQVREMLLNERLITALRKAKSLIEYYEQNAPEAEGDQNLEEGEEEEVIEKPNANPEQPIEEQKQNE